MTSDLIWINPWPDLGSCLSSCRLSQGASPKYPLARPYQYSDGASRSGSSSSSSPWEVSAWPQSRARDSLMLTRMMMLHLKVCTNIRKGEGKRAEPNSELPGLAFTRPKKQIWPFLKIALEIFLYLLSSWAYFRSINAFIVKSKILPFLKQRLAFVSYKHLTTLEPMCTVRGVQCALCALALVCSSGQQAKIWSDKSRSL